MSLLKLSWVESANNPETDFPLNNLPCGVFSLQGDGRRRCCVAIGDLALDLAALEAAGLIGFSSKPVFNGSSWNGFMALGKEAWTSFRARLCELLVKEGDPALSGNPALREKALLPIADVTLHMPLEVAEYTDFFSGKYHALNAGAIIRGQENALPPNWLHMPIGYNGRASSVVVSGTEIRRPWGQLKGADFDAPIFAPSRRFDIELEMGAIVGVPSNGPVSVSEADDMIFGFVLLNDWSARDIQAWEYQPLGPFLAKATATSISPWIVMKEALEPFRCDTPEREKPLLEHLQDCGPMLYDIDLSVHLRAEEGESHVLARTNYREMYYSAAQQLAHHSSSGSPMRVGDLLGSGTISGPEKGNRGSLLELSWGGKEPLDLGDIERTFIEDGDTLTLKGAANGDGYRIGFGGCEGKVLPALDDPYAR